MHQNIAFTNILIWQIVKQCYILVPVGEFNNANLKNYIPVIVWKQYNLKVSASSTSIPEQWGSGDNCAAIANNLEKNKVKKSQNGIYKKKMKRKDHIKKKNERINENNDTLNYRWAMSTFHVITEFWF